MPERFEHRVTRLAQEVIALAVVAGGSKVLANIIIDLYSGAIVGHINQPCAGDPGCVNMVVTTVQNIPLLLSSLYVSGRVVGGIVLNACSAHPNGGTNMSIKGRMK